MVILCNQQVRTNRTTPNNKPDITVRDNSKGSYMLRDVVIPGDRNVIKEKDHKISKYTDLTTEIQPM